MLRKRDIIERLQQCLVISEKQTPIEPFEFADISNFSQDQVHMCARCWKKVITVFNVTVKQKRFCEIEMSVLLLFRSCRLIQLLLKVWTWDLAKEREQRTRTNKQGDAKEMVRAQNKEMEERIKQNENEREEKEESWCWCCRFWRMPREPSWVCWFATRQRAKVVLEVSSASLIQKILDRVSEESHL